MNGRRNGVAPPVDVFLVRHGETTWNREGRIQGMGDSPLTDRGVAQARAVAVRLAAERFEALHCSDLGRARETARHVAEAVQLDVTVHAGLRERSYGMLEGKTWDEICRDHPEAARRLSRDAEYVIPGGESLVQFRDRVTATLGAIASKAGGKPFAVVTHGGVLGIMYRVATDLPLDAPRTYRTVNAGVTHVRYDGVRWRLVRWGEAGHLEGAGTTDDF